MPKIQEDCSPIETLPDELTAQIVRDPKDLLVLGKTSKTLYNATKRVLFSPVLYERHHDNLTTQFKWLNTAVSSTQFDTNDVTLSAHVLGWMRFSQLSPQNRITAISFILKSNQVDVDEDFFEQIVALIPMIQSSKSHLLLEALNPLFSQIQINILFNKIRAVVNDPPFPISKILALIQLIASRLSKEQSSFVYQFIFQGLKVLGLEQYNLNLFVEIAPKLSIDEIISVLDLITYSTLINYESNFTQFINKIDNSKLDSVIVWLKNLLINENKNRVHKRAKHILSLLSHRLSEKQIESLIAPDFITIFSVEIQIDIYLILANRLPSNSIPDFFNFLFPISMDYLHGSCLIASDILAMLHHKMPFYDYAHITNKILSTLFKIGTGFESEALIYLIKSVSSLFSIQQIKHTTTNALKGLQTSFWDILPWNRVEQNKIFSFKIITALAAEYDSELIKTVFDVVGSFTENPSPKIRIKAFITLASFADRIDGKDSTVLLKKLALGVQDVSTRVLDEAIEALIIAGPRMSSGQLSYVRILPLIVARLDDISPLQLARLYTVLIPRVAIGDVDFIFENLKQRLNNRLISTSLFYEQAALLAPKLSINYIRHMLQRVQDGVFYLETLNQLMKYFTQQQMDVLYPFILALDNYELKVSLIDSSIKKLDLNEILNDPEIYSGFASKIFKSLLRTVPLLNADQVKRAISFIGEFLEHSSTLSILASDLLCSLIIHGRVNDEHLKDLSKIDPCLLKLFTIYTQQVNLYRSNHIDGSTIQSADPVYTSSFSR